MYDYEFYDEPSEFEQQIDDFKQSLIKSVKAEYTEEMKRLRKENAELQGVKSRMKEIETEHRQWVWQIERDRKQLEKTVKQARLKELLSDNFVQGYGVDTVYTEKPKCDKCNDKRQLAYTTPRGKTQHEKCECAEPLISYTLIEIECYEFYQSKPRWNDEYPRATVYYSREERSDYDEYNRTSDVYNGEKFEDVNKYGIVFLDKEICQKYCDWLNEGAGK